MIDVTSAKDWFLTIHGMFKIDNFRLKFIDFSVLAGSQQF
jgi:hypothetical protein